MSLPKVFNSRPVLTFSRASLTVNFYSAPFVGNSFYKHGIHLFFMWTTEGRVKGIFIFTVSPKPSENRWFCSIWKNVWSLKRYFFDLKNSCSVLFLYVFWFCFVWLSYEAMSDLVTLLGSLVDVKGKILVPNIEDEVLELTDEEKKLYENLDFDKVTCSFVARCVQIPQANTLPYGSCCRLISIY